MSNACAWLALICSGIFNIRLSLGNSLLHTICSGSNDLLIYVWDLDALMPIFSMEGHEEWVKAVTMAGQSLISGSHDSTIKVWDLTEFTCMQTLKGHRDAVVTLLAQGSIVYSGSEDNSIKVWDLNSLDCVSSLHFVGRRKRVKGEREKRRNCQLIQIISQKRAEKYQSEHHMSLIVLDMYSA